MPTLVTLQNPEGQPAHQFSNTIDGSVPLGPESQVELVSLAVIQSQTAEIDARNNKCSFQIGASTKADVALRQGVYEISELKRELEYQLNAGIPIHLAGTSWHVHANLGASGFLSSWNLRLETSVKNEPVNWDELGSDMNASSGIVPSDGTTIERATGGGNWGPDAFASTSFAVSRGVGAFTATLVEQGGNMPSCAIGLTDRAPDIATDPVDLFDFGVRISFGTSGGTARGHFLYDGEEQEIDHTIWTPTDGDAIIVSRFGGDLVLSVNNGTTITLATESYEDDPDFDVLYPTVQIHTANGKLTECKMYADGDAVTDSLGATRGMRKAGEMPQLTNFRGVVDSSHPGYHELNLAARTRATYETVFSPGTLSDILGFSQGPVKGPRANSVTFSSDSPAYLHAAEQSLEVRLQNLPVQSHSGSTGEASQTVALVPRLNRINGGELYYSPGYSQPVSIKFAGPTATNQFSIEIRDQEGDLADLEGKVSIALRFW
jgi:hypothetical protein